MSQPEKRRVLAMTESNWPAGAIISKWIKALSDDGYIKTRKDIWQTMG